VCGDTLMGYIAVQPYSNRGVVCLAQGGYVLSGEGVVLEGWIGIRCAALELLGCTSTTRDRCVCHPAICGHQDIVIKPTLTVCLWERSWY
jgi:hypothetical protein